MKAQKPASYPHTPAPRREERLIELVRQTRKGEVGLDEVVREFYNCERVRRIARHVSREAGLDPSDASTDEAVQLVADRFFTESIMDTIYDEDNLYSLIYRVAENAIRQEAESNLRWHRKHEPVHEDGPTIEELHVVGDFSGDVLKKINRERSAAELMRRLERKSMESNNKQAYTFSSSIRKFEADIARLAQSTPPRLPAKVSRAALNDKPVPPDVQELRNIRERLGYGVNDLARSLNLSRDKMNAALYGRLLPVPEEIMRDARDLLEASMAAIAAREVRFAQFSNMDELVQFWLKELGLNDNRAGEEELAVILGVFHSTLFRWRKGAYKPKIADVERYDLNVRNAIEQRKVILATMTATVAKKQPAKTKAAVTRKKAAASRSQA